MKISYIPTITDGMIGVDLLNNIMSQKTETLYKYYILETSKTVHYMHVVMVILNEQRFYLFIYFWLYESLLVKWCLCFFLIFIFFYFSILYWFCHISTWICHGCTHVPKPEPPSHLPPHTIPLGHPSAPAPSFLYPASNLYYLNTLINLFLV